jgi:segregation and condensation protein A
MDDQAENKTSEPSPIIQQELPLALVDGQPITDMPQDLYIPPDALSVILEAFEGPLDLLLYLIRRQNMNILSINVSAITRQYMEYIELAEAMKFEMAAEYLVMAATLAEIKSRMLLPKVASDDEDQPDPRAELIRRLQQYERFKQAAEDIDTLPRVSRDVFTSRAEVSIANTQRQQAQVSLEELMLALKGVLARSDLYESHQIEREKLSTRERMAFILDSLSGDAYHSFESFFSVKEGRQGVVVSFLAIMELVKEQLIELIQVNTFGSIHIKARSML